MWNESKPTFKQSLKCYAICVSSSLLSVVACFAQTHQIPRILISSVDHYKVSVYQETIETMQMDRIRMTGRKDILIDPIPQHYWNAAAKDVSARFELKGAPEFKIDVISFPKNSFPHSLTPETLNAYLEGRRLAHTDQSFEILESPEITTGPAKFRIFGERALTLRYSSSQDEIKSVRAENWVEYDQIIYIVAIEAPANAFQLEFRDAKSSFNSMSYLRK